MGSRIHDSAPNCPVSRGNEQHVAGHHGLVFAGNQQNPVGVEYEHGRGPATWRLPVTKPFSVVDNTCRSMIPRLAPNVGLRVGGDNRVLAVDPRADTDADAVEAIG